MGDYLLDEPTSAGYRLTAMNTDQLPVTLQEAITYFADDAKAMEFMRAIRWPDGVVRCARCECSDVLFLANQKRWKCRECKHQFSVKVGTVFEDSPLGLDKWLPAFWMIVNAKNGVSSCELARSLGVTQKSAWFMLHRLRLAIQSNSVMKMDGEVEVDETYIGGRARSMNTKQKAKRRAANPSMKGAWGMSPVQGLLERTTEKKASRVILQHVENNRKKTLDANVRKYVLKGAEVHTDQLLSYENLGDEYTHNVINHAECYAKGKVHTNGMENFWCLLKRAIRGTYVSVEPFHLFRYLDEQAFRFNERKHEDGDRGRFLLAMVGIIGKRLTYKKLTGQDTDGLPALA
jgi:transposase-like protein